MKSNDVQMNPKGSALPKDMRMYRYQLLESLLIAGIPISKVDKLRPFLEKYGHRSYILKSFDRTHPSDSQEREGLC